MMFDAAAGFTDSPAPTIPPANSQSGGSPRQRIPVATRSPADSLRDSAAVRTICGASLVHSLIAPQTANRTSGLLAVTNVFAGGSFDWIISAGVISRAFAPGAVVVQNANPSARLTKRTNAGLISSPNPAPPFQAVSSFCFCICPFGGEETQPSTTAAHFWSIQIAQDRQAKRATGIEPAWPAWKAGTLPLSYARAKNNLPRHPIPAKLFLARSSIRPLAIWIGGG